MGYVHALEDVVDHLLALRCLDLHVDEGQLHVLEDVQFVYEVEALEYEADVAFAVLGALFLFQRAYFLAEELVLARGGVVEEAEDVQEGGLAAAGGAHDCYEFALLDVEGDVVEVMSKETLLRATVSISSVRNTLLKFSTCIITVYN